MASDASIPEALHRFLHTYISSIAQLEVLLLIAGTTDGAQVAAGWTATEATSELRSERSLMVSILQSLEDAGLLACTMSPSGAEPRYRFSPATSALRQSVLELAVLYRERRHSVVAALY